MALGADRARIMRMMIADGFRPVALGIAFGLGFGALARAAMRPIFIRMLPAVDVGALIAVPIIFVVFALVACYLPARRAARVDPSVALRNL
jgi:ABC-type antimicrobial peptide transport system permease subunit